MLYRMLFAVAIAFASPLSAAAGPPEPSWSVREFGAVGDGKADDTAAFQKALDARFSAGGGVVTVPAGRYRIATHLNVPPSVTLEGEWRAPATVDAYHETKDPASGPVLRGSVLLAYEGAGKEDGTPFIRLGTNSTLRGLTVFYPEQTKTNPPKPYPWTVQSSGADNCSLIDVLLVNPYQAVDFGTIVAGRHYIRGLYAQPLRRGLFVDLCMDVGRIEDIHFWPFWTAADAKSPVADFMLEHGEAFILGRSDWEYVTNCFAIGYSVGFRFVRGKGPGPYQGAGNYLLSQSGADMCHTAVLVEETQPHSGVSFSNSQLFGDIDVRATNNGPVRFTGCGFFGSTHATAGTALARLAGPGRISFSNCHFYCIDPKSRGAKAMIVAESGRLSIEGCVFLNNRNTAGVNSNPIPIELRPDVRSAVIMGNEFYGQSRIDNRARGRVVISGNVEQTDEDPYPAPAKPKSAGPRP